MVEATQRRVSLVGANPVVRLFREGAVSAFVSAWRVDWSPHGRGCAVVLWLDGQVHLLAEDPELGAWLERDYTRHFPEVDGLVWPDPVVHRVPVSLDIDLSVGASVRAGGLEVDLSDVRDRRAFATDDFPLGDEVASLSLVLGPCAAAQVRWEGAALPGAVEVSGTPDRPGSSAFITEAEVWRR